MPSVAEICRYVRSKNAGPFWITVDLFFRTRDDFDRYAGAPELSAAAVAGVFGVDAARMRRFALPDLHVVKFSYPRTSAQGGRVERDMHGGQQYVPLLAVTVDAPGAHAAP